DHLVEVHAYHGVTVDQRLELGDHRVQLDLPAPGGHALPVTRQPCLKIVLAIRQPATLTPHVPSRRLNSCGSSHMGIRHGRLTNQHWRLLTCGLHIPERTHRASITAGDADTPCGFLSQSVDPV